MVDGWGWLSDRNGLDRCIRVKHWRLLAACNGVGNELALHVLLLLEDAGSGLVGLEVGDGFHLNLLLLVRAVVAGERIARLLEMLGLGEAVGHDDGVVALLQDPLWNALHGEDFEVDALAAWAGEGNGLEVALVHLQHVHLEATDRLQLAVAFARIVRALEVRHALVVAEVRH